MEWTADGLEWTNTDEEQWVDLETLGEPEVQTVPADPIYATGAVLNGEILALDNISPVTVYFRYRPKPVDE